MHHIGGSKNSHGRCNSPNYTLSKLHPVSILMHRMKTDYNPGVFWLVLVLADLIGLANLNCVFLDFSCKGENLRIPLWLRGGWVAETWPALGYAMV